MTKTHFWQLIAGESQLHSCHGYSLTQSVEEDAEIYLALELANGIHASLTSNDSNPRAAAIADNRAVSSAISIYLRGVLYLPAIKRILRRDED